MRNVFFGAAVAVGLMVGGVMAQCDSVATVSSATRKFVVTGGSACKDSAFINWDFSYTNGNMKFDWGTSATSLPGTKNYTSGNYSKTGNKTVLKPLVAGTKYYYKVTSTYGNGHTLISTSNGTFTTTATTGIVPSVAPKSLINKAIAVRAILFTVSGKMLASCVPSKIRSAALKIGKGAYMVKYYSRSNALIGSEMSTF